MAGLNVGRGRSWRHRLCVVYRFTTIVAITLGCVGALCAEEPTSEAVTADVLLIEGARAYHQGDLDLAIRKWKRATERAAEGASTKAQIEALMDLAKAYQSLGQYRRAAMELSTALSLAETTDDRRTLAIKNSLGAVLTVMRQWDRAEALLIEALVIAEQQHSDAARAVILNNLGNLYAAQGQYPEAERVYEEGFELARPAGLMEEAVKLMANAAVSAGASGRYAGARAYNERAIELLPQIEDDREKVYLLITTGQTDENVLHFLPKARNQLLRRAFDSYRQALDVAHRIGDKRAESYSLGYLGRLYELEQRPDDALRLTRQAVFSAQELRAPELLYRWQWQIGRLLLSKGELEAAIDSLRQAVSTFESIRQEMAGGLGNWSLLTTFRQAVGGMYYDLADAELRLADSVSDPERAQKCVIEAREAVELFKTVELVDYFRDRCVDVFRANVRRIEEVTPDAAVVYLIPLPDRTEVILSHASGLERVKVAVGSEQLASEVRQFRQRLEDRTSRRYLLNAQRLYNWLIEPLEPTLAARGVTTLVFVPDGALRTIPMAALHDDKGFLVERYAMATSPGMTLVAAQPFAPDRGAMLLCGVTKPVGGFSALAYVRTELDRIEELSGGRRLMDDAFRLSRLEKEVSARPPEVLHIASHGQFRGDASKTFVLTYDDKLTLDELEMLVRPSEFRGRPMELLSLSACETAAGDDRAALGLAGVALKAGARSAMATLWFVNDEASARLVSQFYENLYDTPGCSKARALQMAQEDMLRDRRYDHPCYWAPYLIIGNWL